MELLKIESIKTAIESSMQSVTDNIANQLKENALNFIIYILKCLGTFVITTADISCPVICLIALAFYISGNRKAGKYVSGSIVFYVLSLAIRMTLRIA
jgi:predicted RNA-binding protein (virulence factor B family)